jgi:DNA-binding response OmpR family regulator
MSAGLERALRRDDPAVRRLVAEYLSQNEQRVTAVASGKELAAAMARDTVDPVVLDVRLAAEDGLQIARRLREESAIPIWELNVGLRRLKNPAGQTTELTKGEFSLPAAFLSAPQRVLSREQLLDMSRLHNAEVYDGSIDIQILRLRRKIEADAAQPKFIRTERSAGYFFAAPVDVVR